MSTEHFIVAGPDDRDRLTTICGEVIDALPIPGPDAVRCSPCEARTDMLKTVVDYARRWKITPVEAGKALNMPPHVVVALRSVPA